MHNPVHALTISPTWPVSGLSLPMRSAPPPEPQTLFDHTTVTGMAKVVDSADYILGVVVRFAVNGYVDAVSAWVPTGSTRDAGVSRTAGIFSAAGSLLRSGTIIAGSEPAAGNWVTISLHEPILVNAGTDYILGFDIHNGGYSAQAGGFNSAVTRGDLTAPATATVSPGNGRFRSGHTLLVPNTGSSGSNYYVDCRFFATTSLPPEIPSGYPKASNTGTGGTLAPSGGVASSADGQVIQNLNITGGFVTITHDNVTLRNCKVSGHGDAAVFVNVTGTGCVIEDCEIDGTDGSYVGITMDNGGTVRRCKIHGFENGIVMGSNSTIQDNYIYGMNSTAADPHYDSLECNGGSNVLIEHNTVINEKIQTSAVMLNNLYSALSDVTVTDNVISGGGYALYCDGQFAGGSVSNITISDNRMAPGVNGYFAFTSTNPTLSGNVNVYSGLAI